MESRQPPPERSSSNDYIDETQLSFNKLEAQIWDRALESSQRALNQSMNLPGYQDFCDYSAPIRGRDVQESQAWSEGAVSGGPGDDTFQSPSSDRTVKMDDGCRFGQVGEMFARGPAPNFAVPISETGATNGSASSGSDISPLSQRQAFAGVAVESPFRPEFGGPVQTPASHGMRWSPAQLQKEIARNSDSFYSHPSIAKTHVPSRPQSTFPIPRNMPFEEISYRADRTCISEGSMQECQAPRVYRRRWVLVVCESSSTRETLEMCRSHRSRTDVSTRAIR